jgi:hypothetical protein
VTLYLELGSLRVPTFCDVFLYLVVALGIRGPENYRAKKEQIPFSERSR